MTSIYYTLICYTIKQLVSSQWILMVPFAALVLYLLILSYNRVKLFKKTSNELGYPIPDVNNPIFGHSDEHMNPSFEWQCHKQLGKIFGFLNFDKFHLKVADLNLINEIFLKRSKVFNARVWRDVRFLVIVEGILFNKRDRWRQSRKLIQPAMSAYRMRKAETDISDLSVGIQKLVDHFRSLTSSQVTITGISHKDDYQTKGFARIVDSKSQTGFSVKMKAYDLMQVLTLDVIFRIGFNLETIDVTQGSKAAPLRMVTGWLKMLDSYAAKICCAIPFLRPFCYIILFLMYGRQWRQYLKFMDSLVKEDLSQMPNSVKNHMRTAQVEKKDNQPERLYHTLLREYHRGNFTKLELTCK